MNTGTPNTNICVRKMPRTSHDTPRPPSPLHFFINTRGGLGAAAPNYTHNIRKPECYEYTFSFMIHQLIRKVHTTFRVDGLYIKKLAQSYLRLAALCAALLSPQSTNANSPFDTVIQVNTHVITQYELSQRIRFLEVTRRPGNLSRIARESLIDDRLKQQAARAANITLSPEDVDAGLAGMAQGIGQTPQGFITAMAQFGVSEATLRDYVSVNLMWRDVIRARFAGRGSVSAAEIDRTLTLGQDQGGSMRLLVSEIILPVPAGAEADIESLAERLSNLTTVAAFADAAREFSVAASAGNGGALDWVNTSDLPEGSRPAVACATSGRGDPTPAHSQRHCVVPTA